MESTKKLQPDPAEIIAYYSQQSTMIMAAANHHITNITFEDAYSSHFLNLNIGPSKSIICVNLLWYSSLILGICACLVSSMAKGWGNGFMSGRSGRPFAQARLRQQRLDEMHRWRMEDCLNLLPLLIHISVGKSSLPRDTFACLTRATALFIIGLGINLYSIYPAISLPVWILTGICIFIYCIITFLQLKFEHCPYQTPFTPFIKRLLPLFWVFSERWFPRSFIVHLQSLIPRPKERDVVAEQGPILDNLTSRALSWLIKNSQDYWSVNAALQAIAGAGSTLPLGPLIESCDLPALLASRFTGCFLYQGERGSVALTRPGLAREASLYGRGLAATISTANNLSGLSDQWTRDSRLLLRPNVLKAYEWCVLFFAHCL